jgi:hypothetical protein
MHPRFSFAYDRPAFRETDMPSSRWSAINGVGDIIGGVRKTPDPGVMVERLQR